MNGRSWLFPHRMLLCDIRYLGDNQFTGTLPNKLPGQLQEM